MKSLLHSRCLSGALLLVLENIFAAEKYPTPEGQRLRDALVQEATLPLKSAWRPMPLNLAELHGRSVLPARGYFPYPYETIGPGYQDGRMFGHIDLTHERLSAHSRWQVGQVNSRSRHLHT